MSNYIKTTWYRILWEDYIAIYLTNCAIWFIEKLNKYKNRCLFEQLYNLSQKYNTRPFYGGIPTQGFVITLKRLDNTLPLVSKVYNSKFFYTVEDAQKEFNKIDLTIKKSFGIFNTHIGIIDLYDYSELSEEQK
jgi:hypothetical protein